MLTPDKTLNVDEKVSVPLLDITGYCSETALVVKGLTQAPTVFDDVTSFSSCL